MDLSEYFAEEKVRAGAKPNLTLIGDVLPNDEEETEQDTLVEAYQLFQDVLKFLIHLDLNGVSLPNSLDQECMAVWKKVKDFSLRFEVEE
jgi:hypothetical protein